MQRGRYGESQRFAPRSPAHARSDRVALSVGVIERTAGPASGFLRAGRSGSVESVLNLELTGLPNPTERITFNPKECGGRPCIRGMRIRVSDVLELLNPGEPLVQAGEGVWPSGLLERYAAHSRVTLCNGVAQLPPTQCLASRVQLLLSCAVRYKGS